MKRQNREMILPGNHSKGSPSSSGARAAIPASRDEEPYLSAPSLADSSEFHSKNSIDECSTKAGDENALWGHLGLTFPDAAHTKWYPVNSRQACLIRGKLASPVVANWVLVETLNNRLVAFRPTSAQRIWLLDDDCDAPEGDWHREGVFYDADGRSAEFYSALSDWIDDKRTRKDRFSEHHTDGVRTEVLNALEKVGVVDDPEEVADRFRRTIIHFAAGRRTVAYITKPENLSELIFKIEDAEDDEFVEISSVEEEFYSYYSLSMLRMIEIPKSELEPKVRSASKSRPR